MPKPPDPLYLNAKLDYQVELPVLGLGVAFATNDRAVFQQIEGAFGHWRGTESAPPPSGATITVILHDGDEGSSEPPVSYRAPDPFRWIVHTPGSIGLADLKRRSGTAYVTRALVEDRERFRVCILQFIVLIIVSAQDRTPLHAALIARKDSALLLAGPTGSGKSTLAYAASQAGWDLLSDDATFVQLEPKRVWGAGPAAYLLQEAATRFPELQGLGTMLLPTGKRKLKAVSRNEWRPTPWATRAGVCILAKSQGSASVTRVERDDVFELLMQDPGGAGIRFGPRLEGSAAWLSEKGGWRLSLSNDPKDSLPLLEEILQQI